MLTNSFLYGFSVLFDLLLVGLTDACTLLLSRLTALCRLQLTGLTPGDAWTQDHTHTADSDRQRLCCDPAGELQTADPESAVHSSSGPAAIRISILSRAGQPASRRHGGPPRLLGVSVQRLPPCSLGPGLRRLRQLYGSVTDLTSAAAALCSLPTLGLHALITAGLLIGLYVNVVLYRGGGELARAVSYSLFMLLSVVRLALVSVSGSRLAERSQQLHAALAGLRWSGPLTAETRLTLQLLLAQTRQPLGFDGWGLFVTGKATMQSLLSFALTYFVIMIQMNAASEADGAV